MRTSEVSRVGGRRPIDDGLFDLVGVSLKWDCLFMTFMAMAWSRSVSGTYLNRTRLAEPIGPSNALVVTLEAVGDRGEHLHCTLEG